MSAFATGLFAALIFAGAPRADEPKDVKLVQRVYSVGDLVLKPAQKAEAEKAKKAEAEKAKKAETGKANEVANDAEEAGDFEPLVEILTETIAPGTWAKAIDRDETKNTIIPFFLNHSLIVRATPKIHDQVVDRLLQLRRLAPLQGN